MASPRAMNLPVIGLAGGIGAGKSAAANALRELGCVVADAGELMPPKSTWFEPKLRGGVVLHRIKED